MKCGLKQTRLAIRAPRSSKLKLTGAVTSVVPRERCAWLLVFWGDCSSPQGRMTAHLRLLSKNRPASRSQVLSNGRFLSEGRCFGISG